MPSITPTYKETEFDEEFDDLPIKNFIIQENRIKKLKLQRDIAIILFILSLIMYLM